MRADDKKRRIVKVRLYEEDYEYLLSRTTPRKISEYITALLERDRQLQGSRRGRPKGSRNVQPSQEKMAMPKRNASDDRQLPPVKTPEKPFYDERRTVDDDGVENASFGRTEPQRNTHAPEDSHELSDEAVMLSDVLTPPEEIPEPEDNTKENEEAAKRLLQDMQEFY